MPDIVYCDNKDCVCYDDYYERCDAYRLVIERGVCTGSPRHGRNVSENDLDERLKAENTELRYKVHILEGGNKGLQILNDSLKANNDKLRELCMDMFTTISWCNLDCYPSDNKKREYVDRLRELGIEVE